MTRNGFTLVELLIALAIMGTMAVGGYPRLMQFAQETRLQQEARVVYQDLCLVRQAAISAGFGTSRINFIRNPANSFTTIYEMFAPDGSDVRSVLMDQVSNLGWQHNLASHSICITLHPSLASTTPNNYTLQFDSRGRMCSLPATASGTLTIQAFDPITQTPLQEIQPWTIIIGVFSATPPSLLAP